MSIARQETTTARGGVVALPRARARLAGLALVARDVLAPFVVTRLALVLVGLLADFYILPLMRVNRTGFPLAADMRLPRALWAMWRRFDSGFYVDIAHNGYWRAASLHHFSDWVFYPLFPLVTRPVGLLLGGGDTAFSVAGVLVSNATALVGLCYLYALVARELGRTVAARTVLFLSVFPTAFYLSAIYPHGLFLACAVASIYYARARRWWPAGLCGGLTALTHADGVLLIVPLAWEYAQALADRYAPLPPLGELPLHERARAWLSARARGLLLAARHGYAWASAPALALVPLGLGLFLFYSWAKTGDPLASTHNYGVWGRHFAYPWTLLRDALRHPAPANPLDWHFWQLNIVLAFAYLGFTVWAFRRLPIIYALYTLVMTLLPLASTDLQSLGRVYLTIFPACMLLALWSGREGQAGRAALITASFAALQAVFMIFFVLGLPAIA